MGSSFSSDFNFFIFNSLLAFPFRLPFPSRSIRSVLLVLLSPFSSLRLLTITPFLFLLALVLRFVFFSLRLAQLLSVPRRLFRAVHAALLGTSTRPQDISLAYHTGFQCPLSRYHKVSERKLVLQAPQDHEEKQRHWLLELNNHSSAPVQTPNRFHSEHLISQRQPGRNIALGAKHNCIAARGGKDNYGEFPTTAWPRLHDST